MKINNLVSIIVPVYNTEKYIKRCLDSLIDQSYKKCEIIIVNDGSTDKSENICLDYLKYKNVFYYSKKNSGQGSARNLGLKKSKGDYIVFVDSDDFIDTKMVETLLKKAKSNDSDIVYCDFMKGTENKYKITKCIFNKKYDDKTNYILENAGPCNALFKKQTLVKNNFTFPERIIYEDLSVIPIIGMKSEIVSYISLPLYYYFVREGSSMKIMEYNDKFEDIFISINILVDSYKTSKLSYKAELEFILIRRLMSASLRFIGFGDPNNCIQRISQFITENIPNWKKNMYYKELTFRKKIVAYLSFNNKKNLLKLLYIINRGIK